MYFTIKIHIIWLINHLKILILSHFKALLEVKSIIVLQKLNKTVEEVQRLLWISI